MVTLDPTQARVLGALMEKEATTPEYYPLSLNALVNACNQKSSRDPVMQLSEADVRTALFDLDALGLVRTLADGRVSKFEHRVRDGLGGEPLRRDEVAALCLLLLRGAQTPGELRSRSERLYNFDDTAAVVTTLDRLARRPDPLALQMERQPGAREARWMHLLTGPVEAAASASAYTAGQSSLQATASNSEQTAAELASLHDRVSLLEDQVASLNTRMETLARAFGVE